MESFYLNRLSESLQIKSLDGTFRLISCSRGQKLFAKFDFIANCSGRSRGTDRMGLSVTRPVEVLLTSFWLADMFVRCRCRSRCRRSFLVCRPVFCTICESFQLKIVSVRVLYPVAMMPNGIWCQFGIVWNRGRKFTIQWVGLIIIIFVLLFFVSFQLFLNFVYLLIKFIFKRQIKIVSHYVFI